MANHRYRLSKSKLISGWQCPKRLWLEIHKPGELAFSAATQNAFDIGHRVGEAAQSLFPEGVLIEHHTDMKSALEQTREHISRPGPVTLFEATFQAQGVLIRADVLVRDANNEYRLIEVKASTQVKDYHLTDCAIQLWVLEHQGFRVNAVELAHINNQFVYQGDGDYTGLFTYADVAGPARNLQPGIPDLVNDLTQTLAGTEPEIDMGDQCNNPFDCPFIGYCTGPQPEMPVSWIPGGRSVALKLIEKGFADIREIPEGLLDNKTREWVRKVTLSGKPDLKPGAAKALENIGWPRYYFDFETLNPAVPVFRGTRPYEAQAFQWSCHIETENGEIEHREFLADGKEPPTRPCATALVKNLGHTGPILVYSSYEKTTLKSLAKLKPRLEAIINRLVDLLPITRANYYHPDMHGSWSIKNVLPTISSDLDYANLDLVTEGSQAQIAYLEMINMEVENMEVINTDKTHAKKEQLKNALLRYCKLDTQALVAIAHYLEGRLPG